MMNPLIIKFIKQNKELIQNNQYDELYDELLNFKMNNIGWLSGSDVGKVTKLFYDIGELDKVLESLDELPLYMFLGVKGIDSITIPKNIKIICQESFEKSGFNKVVFEGCTIIGRQAFHGSDVKEIVLPETLTSIQEQAFRFCKYIKSIKLPKSLNSSTSLGIECFDGCTSLEEVYVPHDSPDVIRRVLKYTDPEYRYCIPGLKIIQY